MRATHEPLTPAEQKIADAWAALFEALGTGRRKFRGVDIGLAPATRGPNNTGGALSVERFLELKAIRDARRTRVGVR